MKTLKSKKLFVSAGILMLLVTFSCKKKGETTASCTSTISYANDIALLMSQSCIGCHNSNNSSAGYDLTNHSNVASNAGIILNSMRHTSGAKAMPQGGSQLSSSVMDQFDC